jgi:hypothetical protein
VPALTVAAIQVNDGSVQRSEVWSIKVSFSAPVVLPANVATAFQLRRVTDAEDVSLWGIASGGSQGYTSVTLYFTGPLTDPVSGGNGVSPSLADGRYTLTVFADKVTGASGSLFDGNGDGTPGDNYISPTDTPAGGPGQYHLFRLFGDTTGDGVVDLNDLAAWRNAYNTAVGQSGYVPYLDANNDHSIDLTDLAQFRSRINHNVIALPPPPTFYVNPATGNDANNGRSPGTAWATWGRLIQAVNDGTITGGAWVNSNGGAADISTIPTDQLKENWYTGYLAGQRQLTGAHIYIDTSQAPLRVTGALELPPGCDIESATNQLTDLRVNVAISSSEVWARPDSVNDPAVWGTSSSTSYKWTGLYERIAGQWVQLQPLSWDTPNESLSAMLAKLQATPGSFYVDPATNRLYTHSLAGGNPNTDGVSRQYVPAWATMLNGRVVEVTGGRIFRIGGDGGFGFDPTTGEAQGANGIGSGDWTETSVIDSCQWTRAGKHTFSAIGNSGYGFVVFRNDTAEEGPGGVFVGYWSHFVDYTSFSGTGSAMSIYDGDKTVNGWANVNAPGGSDVYPTYQALIAHSDDTTLAFSRRLIENCNFAGMVSLGGPETAVAEMRDSFVAGPMVTTAVMTTIDRTKGEYRLPIFDGETATVTDSIFVPGTAYQSQPGDMQGTVTFNRCTIDLTQGNNYSTAWLRTAALTLTITNSVILNHQNDYYGLVNGVHPSDSFDIDHSLIQGSTAEFMVQNYGGVQSVASYVDGFAGLSGLAVTNTRFVANAMLDPSNYAPLPGSPAVGQGVTVANATDYTGAVWSVRHTAGAFETSNPVVPWSLSELPNFVDAWDSLPTRLFQDAAETTLAQADGDPVGGWVGQVNNVELTSSGNARPTLTTVGTQHALALNGSAHFDPIEFGTDGGVTMAFAVKYTATGNYQALFYSPNGTSGLGVEGIGKLDVDYGSIITSASYASAIHRIIFRELYGHTDIWVDGTRVAFATWGSIQPAILAAGLFNDYGGYGLHASLYGFAAVGEWISDADLAALDATLAASI